MYILQRRPILQTDDGRIQLSPGMCVGFSAGKGNANNLINETDEDVLYLIIGDRTPGDEAVYSYDDIQASLVDGTWAFTHKDGSPYSQQTLLLRMFQLLLIVAFLRHGVELPLKQKTLHYKSL